MSDPIRTPSAKQALTVLSTVYNAYNVVPGTSNYSTLKLQHELSIHHNGVFTSTFGLFIITSNVREYKRLSGKMKMKLK